MQPKSFVKTCRSKLHQVQASSAPVEPHLRPASSASVTPIASTVGTSRAPSSLRQASSASVAPVASLISPRRVHSRLCCTSQAPSSLVNPSSSLIASTSSFCRVFLHQLSPHLVHSATPTPNLASIEHNSLYPAFV